MHFFFKGVSLLGCNNQLLLPDIKSSVPLYCEQKSLLVLVQNQCGSIAPNVNVLG